MLLIESIFWLSLFILFYSYIGYGIVLWASNRFKALFNPRTQSAANDLPSVTFIVPAYNEESILEQKILNTIGLDYPADKLQLIFITDGSTDSSSSIVEKYPYIHLLHDASRQGK